MVAGLEEQSARPAGRIATHTRSDWIWEMGPDMKFTYVSERFFELTGTPVSELVGQPRSAVVEQSTHGPWQMAARSLPCSAQRRTRRSVLTKIARRLGSPRALNARIAVFALAMTNG